jgi:hypothetical protein
MTRPNSINVYLSAQCLSGIWQATIGYLLNKSNCNMLAKYLYQKKALTNNLL